MLLGISSLTGSSQVNHNKKIKNNKKLLCCVHVAVLLTGIDKISTTLHWLQRSPLTQNLVNQSRCSVPLCSTETSLVNQSRCSVPLCSTGTSHLCMWYVTLTVLQTSGINDFIFWGKTENLVTQPWSKTGIVHCTFDIHVSVVTVKAVVHLWAAVSLLSRPLDVSVCPVYYALYVTCCTFSH